MLPAVVRVPADFLKVPELLNAAVPPKKLTITASPLESHVPVLLITDPVPVRTPWPEREVQFAVVALFSVRLPLIDTPPLTLKGAFTVVVSAPVLDPPDQLYLHAL